MRLHTSVATDTHLRILACGPVWAVRPARCRGYPGPTYRRVQTNLLIIIEFHEEAEKKRILAQRRTALMNNSSLYFSQFCGSRIRDDLAPFLNLWIRNPGWIKKSRSGSGMNILNHISESLETIFRVKNYLMRIRSLFKPGSGMEKIRIRDGKNLSRIRNNDFSFYKK